MRVFILLPTLAVFTGCQTLQGDWSGATRCKSGLKFKTVATIERTEGKKYAFNATLLDAMSCTLEGEGGDEVPCNVEADGEIQLDSPFGEQDIGVAVDECAAVADIGTAAIRCDDPKSASWDGTNEIDMEIDLFEIECIIELERD